MPTIPGALRRLFGVGCIVLLAPGGMAGGVSAEQTPTTQTRLILLGTAGGPSPKQTRSAPANAVVVNDAVYVVDAGNGVARQLVRAGLAPRNLRAVFITHHHSDHNADYGNLVLLAWTAGLRRPVDTYRPPPLARMTELFLALNARDIELRQDEEGVPSDGPDDKAEFWREGVGQQFSGELIIGRGLMEI